MADRNVSVTITADTTRYVAGMEQAMLWATFGFRVVISRALPMAPSFAEQLRRRVRHGLIARCPAALRTLRPGPGPDEVTHSFWSPVDRILFVDQETYDHLVTLARRIA